MRHTFIESTLEGEFSAPKIWTYNYH